MKYFSEESAEEIMNDYSHLIGNSFWFDETKPKEKLVDIRKQPKVSGFDVMFVSAKGSQLSILKFMKLNIQIPFPKENYESA